MQGNIHAVLLIALSAAVLASLSAMKRRMPTGGQVSNAFAIVALGVTVVMLANNHLCYEGQPLMQWLILGPCLLLVLLFVSSPARRRMMGAAVFVGMMGLSCHFTALVHEPGWTGNPDWDGGAHARLIGMHLAMKAAAADSDDPEVELQPGWLRELPIEPAIKDALTEEHPARRDVHRIWHTWLTGLYRYSIVQQDYWYPGGPLADAAERLELRDRAEE